MHIKMLLFFVLFLPMLTQARVIDYEKKAYRHKMDNKMKGHGESALFIVPLIRPMKCCPINIKYSANH